MDLHFQFPSRLRDAYKCNFTFTLPILSGNVNVKDNSYVTTALSRLEVVSSITAVLCKTAYIQGNKFPVHLQCQRNDSVGFSRLNVCGIFFLYLLFIVPPVLLQTISTLMSLLMACRKCIQ